MPNSGRFLHVFSHANSDISICMFHYSNTTNCVLSHWDISLFDFTPPLKGEKLPVYRAEPIKLQNCLTCSRIIRGVAVDGRPSLSLSVNLATVLIKSCL